MAGALSADELLVRAGQAMYRAEAAGSEQYAVRRP
jgi:GGDEF domain-containing protein